MQQVLGGVLGTEYPEDARPLVRVAQFKVGEPELIQRQRYPAAGRGVVERFEQFSGLVETLEPAKADRDLVSGLRLGFGVNCRGPELLKESQSVLVVALQDELVPLLQR